MEIKIYCTLLCLLIIIYDINSLSPKCTISKMSKRNRIIVPYDYTFLAQILLQKKLICSATIVHNCWLLSAASCFDLTKNWPSYEVLVGVTGVEETYSLHPVIQVLVEDNYHYGSNEHNIALIQVDYMDNINYLSSINLVSTRMNFIEPVYCIILGYKSENISELNEIKMQVANLPDCNYKMNALRKKERRYKPNTIGKNNFCLISTEDRNETLCKVTVGGPVLCSSNEHLRGIVVDFPMNKQCKDIGPIPVIDISTESEWLQESILNLNKHVSTKSRSIKISAGLKCKSLHYFMIFPIIVLWYNYR